MALFADFPGSNQTVCDMRMFNIFVQKTSRLRLYFCTFSEVSAAL
jgi:hypothetical protein